MPADRGFKVTPVIQQYLEIKRSHADAFLFFRLGDFYEMFFEDAERASKLLDLTLTTRNRNEARPIPLCGVPYHSARPYIAKLIDAGFKVAICEQIDPPEAGSKLASRRVTKVITPGTAIDEENLEDDRSRYLACVAREAGAWGLAWTDFSTGEVLASEFADAEAVADELSLLDAREILVPEAARDAIEPVMDRARRECLCTYTPEPGGLRSSIQTRALRERPAVTAALAGLRAYIASVQGDWSGHLRDPVLIDSGAFLKVDAVTRDHLELVQTRQGDRKGSLLDVTDASVTAMGSRLTARWLTRPLARAAAIGERLDAVEFFFEAVELRARVRETIEKIGDLERLVGRVGSGNAGPREVVALARALEPVGQLRQDLLAPAGPAPLRATASELDALPEVQVLVGAALAEDPPASVRQGGAIREGHDPEADRLRSIASQGRDWIAAMEASERRRTGIATLKVGYNKVFGYYLEAGKSHAARIPADYERKQTLTNAERYVTPALKQREGEVLGAQERLLALEAELFAQVVARIRAERTRLAATASALARLDAWAGLAETAHRRSYVRPQILTQGTLEIVEGRHPVVEAALGRGFVANDCRLGEEDATLAVITGPNMAGKSTYLRQTALIVLLAHAGCFVPATSARVPLTDRIFARIGATDDLAGGRSTFMVEMSETAAILADMTPRSLVILDEIGRGTSTYDGISIAWAVAEALIAAGVKTLFATHYYELAQLAEEHEAVKNLSVSVKRYRGEVVFLYRVLPGTASGSFGIDVARLAGLPDEVVSRAAVMLERLQAGGRPHEARSAGQLGLFSATDPGGRVEPGRSGAGAEEGENAVIRALREADLDRLTPLEAMNFLSELVGRLRKEG